MVFKGKRIFNASFDDYATTYDQVRPSYPAQLFQDLREACQVEPEAEILEIGAGSGIATEQLAQTFKTQRILALEPGQNLLKVAQQRVKSGNVQFLCDTFEHYAPGALAQHQHFELVTAFTALHWLKSDTAMEQITRLLSTQGYLAVVWNSFFQSESPVMSAIGQVYREVIPDVYPNGAQTAEVNAGVAKKLDGRIAALVAQPGLRPVQITR